MSSNKHPEFAKPDNLDLKTNPAIGSLKGAINARDPDDELEGENTFEGDVMNDASLGGGVNPNQRSRTNK